MKLVLHIGTHKTGTTAVQRFLSQNRVQLLEMGYYYPVYSDVIQDKSDHYAHIDVAKGLMGQSQILSVEESKQFLSEVSTIADKKGAHTTLLSAESFIRGMTGTSSKKWNRIESFIRLVKSCITSEDVEVTMTIRSLATYLTSLYNEHVKVTGYSKDIISFHSEFRERFNYPLLIEKWSKYFPKLSCLQYEKLGKGNEFIENWLRATLGEVDMTKLDFSDGPRNISWPIEFVAIKRELNAHLSANGRTKLRNQITECVRSSDVIFSDKKVLSWLTDEQLNEIISSHKRNFEEILCDYDIDLDLVLKNNQVPSDCVFKSVSNEYYHSLLKQILDGKK